VKEGLSILGGLEGLIALGLVVTLVTIVVLLMWRKKCDPKLDRLLALMKDFPKEGNDQEPRGGQAQNGGDGEDQGPLGPDGFGHIALDNSNSIGYLEAGDSHPKFLADLSQTPFLPSIEALQTLSSSIQSRPSTGGNL
jgi:hypothetical protein